jgi:hypothetical protein
MSAPYREITKRPLSRSHIAAARRLRAIDGNVARTAARLGTSTTSLEIVLAGGEFRVGTAERLEAAIDGAEEMGARTT